MKTNKIIKISVSIVLCISLFMTSFVTVFANNSSDKNLDGDLASLLIRQAINLVQQNYRFEISNEELYKNALMQVLKEHPEIIESAFKGVFDNLDEFSRYFTESELNEFYNQLSGEVCGIGVLVTQFSGGLLITSVYDNSPASEAGLKSGDVIISANGESIVGMDIDLATGKITGAEGTSVKIGLKRDNQTYEYTLTRRKVTVESGQYWTLENNSIGYIELYSFDEHAPEFVKKALKSFGQYNIKNIIMDLRNNPGGSLYSMVDISQNFIPKGPITHIDYTNASKSFTLESDNANPKYNVIVLVNEYSASASEAFAGAVQDTGVGIVLGVNSYGKGTMQNVTKFTTGGGIKLTEAYYLTPNGRNINGKGVEPDLVVHESMVPYKKAGLIPMNYDRILQKGDSGDDVRAINQRLALLGYGVKETSDVYTDQTYYSVLRFQETTGLFPYGVMDITTQVELENMFLASKISDNKTYHTAVDIFRTGTMAQYKHTWEGPADFDSSKYVTTGNLTIN